MSDRGEGQFGPTGLLLRLSFRSPLRLCALWLLFALIAFLLAGIVLLRSAVVDSATIWSKRLGADLMIVPAGTELRLAEGLIGGAPVRFSLPEGTLSAVAALPGISLVAPQYFLASARSACCEAGDLLLVGFDPGKDFTVRPWLQNNAAEQPGGEAVLVGGGVMKAKGAALRLYNRTFTVAARLEKSGLGYFDNAVFIPLAGVAAMERASRSAGAAPFTLLWGRPSLLLVKLAPQLPARETAATLQQRLPGVRVLTIPELFLAKREQLARFTSLQTPLALGAWLLAMTAGGALQLLYWRGRRPLLGLLQAWGWRKQEIMAFFALEVLLLSTAGMVAGMVGAQLLLRLFAPFCALLLGVPLLPGGGILNVAGAVRLWLLFAGAMTLETVMILSVLLRREPAELLRADR